MRQLVYYPIFVILNEVKDLGICLMKSMYQKNLVTASPCCRDYEVLRNITRNVAVCLKLEIVY